MVRKRSSPQSRGVGRKGRISNEGKKDRSQEKPQLPAPSAEHAPSVPDASFPLRS